MVREEVELLPSGLVTCLLDDKEVRILKISPERLTVRVDCEFNKVNNIKVSFYIFDEYRYEEIKIDKYETIEIKKEEFYVTYVFEIEDNEFLKNVRNITRKYTKYIMLKNFGYENEFSEEMVNYPVELDYEFFEVYKEQKKEWLSNLNYSNWNEENMNSVELALNLDNHVLFENYLLNDIKLFKESYLRENFVKDHKLFTKDISRLYIGNEFCHNLFPKIDILLDMLNKSKEEKLEVTLCFTYLRECYIEKNKSIIETVYNWCSENNKKIEIVINDWGMLKLIDNKTDLIKPSLGILLNKRKKDPRYMYKKGYKENKELMAKNDLNSIAFNEFLKEYKIERYEYENCGYKVNIAKGKHSLHMPFYQTNTSQYCTLYAMCKNLDRGKQKLVKCCPKYCKDYVFAYPKHLKMVGRYNSLFAFDDTLLKSSDELLKYINNGIDRIVLNFI